MYFFSGITNADISYMIGYFATVNATAVDLLSIILEAVDLLYKLSNLWCNALIGTIKKYILFVLNSMGLMNK